VFSLGVLVPEICLDGPFGLELAEITGQSSVRSNFLGLFLFEFTSTVFARTFIHFFCLNFPSPTPARNSRQETASYIPFDFVSSPFLNVLEGPVIAPSNKERPFFSPPAFYLRLKDSSPQPLVAQFRSALFDAPVPPP